MRYAQLRAFHHVALHMGFSAAAKALQMTQPALSDQVRKLEQAYDVLLFDRSRRQIRLTPIGEDLFAHTRRLFECEAMTEEFLSQTRNSRSSSLIICSDTPFHYMPILRRFRDAHPNVRIDIRTGNSREVIAALKDYEADIGVLGTRAAGNEFHQVSLGTSDIVAFTARDADIGAGGTVSLSDLRGIPLVLREQGSRTRASVDAMFEVARIPMRILVEAEGREAVREVVAAGGSVGFVSEAEFGSDPRLKKLRILGAQSRMEENVICLADRAMNTLIAEFMAIARKA